jgi:hypothetical protein
VIVAWTATVRVAPDRRKRERDRRGFGAATVPRAAVVPGTAVVRWRISSGGGPCVRGEGEREIGKMSG